MRSRQEVRGRDSYSGRKSSTRMGAVLDSQKRLNHSQDDQKKRSPCGMVLSTTKNPHPHREISMDTVDVDARIDKVLEKACDRLREAMHQLGRLAADDELSFLELERRFTGHILEFARSLLAVLLARYDCRARYLRHEDTVWRRTSTTTKSYRSMWGPLEVERVAYLPVGQASGSQLVPLELRAGLIDGTWTPQCAEAMARMVQSVPAHEAIDNLTPMGLLDYSRSSFERVARTLGRRRGRCAGRSTFCSRRLPRSPSARCICPMERANWSASATRTSPTGRSCAMCAT